MSAAVVASVVAGATFAVATVVALINDARQPKTPPSNVVFKTFGHAPVVFDKVYEGPHNNVRVVILDTPDPPVAVIGLIRSDDGWQLTDGTLLERKSDGLCVLAQTAAEYASAHNGDGDDALGAAARHPTSVVLSLDYC